LKENSSDRLEFDVMVYCCRNRALPRTRRKPAAESFRLQAYLRGWTWKLCGAEIPEELQVRLAQEIVKNNGEYR
jgi:hypothetical protein